ncbi:MAG: hypothetical protein K6A94_00825 [Bacteroidales bacterium]|nr:hypothetical protein [Bacteroidales bacterium]
MRIDLTIPTRWEELTSDQLREVVEASTKGLRREELLLILLCRFAGIKMMAGTTEEDGKKVVHTRFKDAEGRVFDLEDWQVAEFCGMLAYLADDDMPLGMNWPFTWDTYLMNTTFEQWFHADALLLGYAKTKELKYIEGAMKDLGGKPVQIEAGSADVVLMLKWWDLFSEWLREQYPLVLRRAKAGGDTVASPIENRKNIMLMLNDGRPQDNELIEAANVHDVLAALQHKIEEEKHIEQQMSKYKR